MIIEGDKVYFIYYDSVDKRSKNGWCVSNAHTIIDTCERGFFTGNDKDFPNNADFTSWERAEVDVFFNGKAKAQKMVERLAEMGLNEKEGYLWMEEMIKERMENG